MTKQEKQALSEIDICDLFITPAIKGAGWDQHSQMRREVTLTPGPVVVRGNMSSRNKKKKKFADYVLLREAGVPVAVIEAKDNNHTVSQGLQQALGYAGILNVPCAFSSNGDAFASHNQVPAAGEDIECEFPLTAFPSPDELWTRYKKHRNIKDADEELVLEPYHLDAYGKEPRYYQSEAINLTMEAIARGQKRLLLVMATGTGKTYTTFQIIWRLWKAKKAKRTLFLVDRNILADQTLVNDFKPFGAVMTKIKNRKIDPSYEIYLGLYQAITGPDEEDKIFKNVSRDFFDLIIIDECHRGSAADDSAWREILDYFSSATQIGLTATPKETKYASNITYFGEPIYTYRLKQGIEDGFLAPYKVVRYHLDRDLIGWTPPPGMKDDLGQEIEQRTYNQADMDRILVLNQRTKLVAKCVMELLMATDPFSKTIIFCEDIDHAERMRVAITNAAGRLALENPKYVMRITGDSVEGKAELDNFIDPESRFPVIATTSELLTTGVDAKTCKLIVLDKTINSMTTFKQIVGRGTRIDEEFGKFFFTVMDFKKATELFKDPDFDGDPVVIYEPDPGDDPVPPDPEPDDSAGEDEQSEYTARKIHVSSVDVKILAKTVEYRGDDGQMVTESYRDYSRKYGLNIVSWPSKALFAGDKEAYDQVFKSYRDQKRREVLSGDYIKDTFGDDHWFERNEQRFDQLVALLKEDSVVPFIGAGVSVAGGFPTWKDHLSKQGKTAGIASAVIEAHLANGEYEAIIEMIETTCGADVFSQEIRDAFSKTGKLEEITLRITELFKDTLITTNYDRLLEQAFDTGPGEEVQVINSTDAMVSPDPSKIAIIKLHGDVHTPGRCILGKRQYDEAYGESTLDLARPIPKLLQYHYTTSSLLFVGCSLNNDRTVQVFRAVKADRRAKGTLDLPQHFSIEQAPETVAELTNRNAELVNLGITPIWFPKGDFTKVEAILRHAYNELKYQAV